MFQENIEIIKNTFLEYKGTGMYIALFFVSMLYILLKEENKRNKAFFVYFPIFTLFITLNPIFNKLVGSIFTSGVYWRVYWIIPLGITIAYGAVKFISNEKEMNKKIIATIGVVLIIIISGKLVYNKENFKKFDNLYKIPDEVVRVTGLISADEEEYKKALVSQNLVAYIRQIDASILLAYRREPEGYTDNKYVLTMLSGNSEEIVKLAKANECNYIVLDRGLVITLDLHYFGFERFAETENFVIYKISKEENKKTESQIQEDTNVEEEVK